MNAKITVEVPLEMKKALENIALNDKSGATLSVVARRAFINYINVHACTSPHLNRNRSGIRSTRKQVRR